MLYLLLFYQRTEHFCQFRDNDSLEETPYLCGVININILKQKDYGNNENACYYM